MTAEAPILTLTDTARDKLIELREAKGQHDLPLRLAVVGRDVDEFQYELRFVSPDSAQTGDMELQFGDLAVIIAANSLDLIRGTEIDFGGLAGGSLRVDNPNAVWPDDLSREVAGVILNQINPGIAAHGGFVNLLEVKDHTAFIKMGGGCQGCGAADVTLRLGIQRMIRQAVPDIAEVVDVTDHAHGENPYYAAQGQSPIAEN